MCQEWTVFLLPKLDYFIEKIEILIVNLYNI